MRCGRSGTATWYESQDDTAAAWHYHYDRHLVTRYSDRTGRGMNLAWDIGSGGAPHAKAVREWADDGSDDTRLEWDKIRRRKEGTRQNWSKNIPIKSMRNEIGAK